MKLLFAVLVLLFASLNAKAASLTEPEFVFESKFWQIPKPYVGLGFVFSNMGLNGATNETMAKDFFGGISQFQNLSLHFGLRCNGFIGAELEYARAYKSVFDSSNNLHNFTSDIILLKAMLYPLTIDFGAIGSLELFLSFGTAIFASVNSNYTSNGRTFNDNINNTFNLSYGGGVQYGFSKYVAIRFEVNAISPTNGSPFGSSPYGNVMLLYTLGISFYPF